MNKSTLEIEHSSNTLSLNFYGEFTLYLVSTYEAQIKSANYKKYQNIEINLDTLSYIDTAAAIYLNSLINKLNQDNISYTIHSDKKEILDTLDLTKKYHSDIGMVFLARRSLSYKLGKYFYEHIIGLFEFMAFLGKLFATKLYYIRNIHQIRFKEILFEMNESAIKAFGIISITSFLIGLVVAYQSAYQLKIYGANIFIVDMLGLSILRELAPVITAIVIAGRSGSAFTAQIVAMKITEELDAMRTMGFDPYIFLVLPRIIALMIAMPILIFVADIMGVFGGILVAHIDLDISPQLFLERFNEVVLNLKS